MSREEVALLLADATRGLREQELDAARRTGPHRADCPAWEEDPDGIEQCPCPEDGVR